MNQDRMDRYFMKVALLTAELSYAIRKKVGAVLVKDNRIISVGFNGQPAKWDNACEDMMPDGTLITKPTVIHAEANAILNTYNEELDIAARAQYLQQYFPKTIATLANTFNTQKKGKNYGIHR